jgi:hypothetical protein
MEKRFYQPPKAALVLPDVLCRLEFDFIQQSGERAVYATSKEASFDFMDEDEDFDKDLDWSDDTNLWK